MPLERTTGTQIAQSFWGRFLCLAKLLLPWHLNSSTTPLLLPVFKTYLLFMFSLTTLSSSLTEIIISSRLLACHLHVIGWMSTKATKCMWFMYIFGDLSAEDQRLEAFHTHSVVCPWLCLPCLPSPVAPWCLFPKLATYRKYLPPATA